MVKYFNIKKKQKKNFNILLFLIMLKIRLVEKFFLWIKIDIYVLVEHVDNYINEL